MSQSVDSRFLELMIAADTGACAQTMADFFAEDGFMRLLQDKNASEQFSWSAEKLHQQYAWEWYYGWDFYKINFTEMPPKLELPEGARETISAWIIEHNDWGTLDQ